MHQSIFFHPPADFWWLTLGGLVRRPSLMYRAVRPSAVHLRVSVTAAIVPARALLLRALACLFHSTMTHRALRTLLYCYYNDTLLCLNIWVRILLKPYIYIYIYMVRFGPAQNSLKLRLIFITSNSPHADIVYMVFNEFNGVYRGGYVL